MKKGFTINYNKKADETAGHLLKKKKNKPQKPNKTTKSNQPNNNTELNRPSKNPLHKRIKAWESSTTWIVSSAAGSKNSGLVFPNFASSEQGEGEASLF